MDRIKIFYPCILDYGTTDYPLFLTDAILETGNEIHLFPIDINYENTIIKRFISKIPFFSKKIEKLFIELKLKRSIRSIKPDIMLIGGIHLSKSFINIIKSDFKCKTGLIMGYSELLIPERSNVMSDFDFIVTIDSYLIPIIKGERYHRVKNVFWRFPAADLVEHSKIHGTQFQCSRYKSDIVFIGGFSKNRLEILKEINKYFDLKIWGSKKWKDTELDHCYNDEPIYGLKKTLVYSNAKIIINIADNEKHVNAVNERVPEGLLCNTFVLSCYTEDLSRMGLIPNESIGIYSDRTDVVEKIKYFLDNPYLMKSITKKGNEIIKQKFTYTNLASYLISKFQNMEEN